MGANNGNHSGVERYLSGPCDEGAAQAEIKPGDPQQSALAQYLSGRAGRLQDRWIVDFGSGRGLLAVLIAEIWGDASPPWYLAVDLPEPLERLSLPRSVHNRSRKVTVDEFYNGGLQQVPGDVGAVVIRNVLHELDINETARLFWFLDHHLGPGSEVYVQDMASLPRAERRHAGWLPEVLVSVLRRTGHETAQFQLESHAGTPWFALIVKPSRSPAELDALARAFADGRAEQQKHLARMIADETEAEAPDVAALVRLGLDMGAVATQLHNWEQTYGVPSSGSEGPERPAVPFPIVPRETFAPYDRVEVVSGSPAESSGLVAILSHKRLLDFPTLIRSARERILMMGYSQRSLFDSDESVMALREATLGGPEPACSWHSRMESLRVAGRENRSTVTTTNSHGTSRPRSLARGDSPPT